MNPTFRDSESCDNLLIDIDNNCGFEEMFSDFTGSFGVIMATISAGEAGRINGSNGDCVVGGIEYFQGAFEENIEVDRFDSAEEFLECGEVRYRSKTKCFPDPVHFFKVTDDRTVVFLPVFFEEKNRQKLVLGVVSSRIFTGIKGEMG